MRKQSGFSMIEILITIAILVVGLLGLAGLQANVAKVEFEAYQRAQAIVLVQEIADRINANKRNALSYVANDIGASGVALNCTALTGVQYDLCDINNIVVGSSEKQTAGGPSVGGMLNARACITTPAANVYVVTVVWQGMRKTRAPVEACGAGQYGDDSLRRTVSFPVRVATLTAP
jgi:type IV pilus assembly protein PilV